MGSFSKVVKLNCLLQDEGGNVKNAPGALDFPFAGLVPCVRMLGLGLGCFVCLFNLKSPDSSFAPILHGMAAIVALIYNLSSSLLYIQDDSYPTYAYPGAQK